jgi:hypothetical protein
MSVRGCNLSLAPLLAGRGLGIGARAFAANAEAQRMRTLPLTRIASDDAEPVIGRAFARPVGIAEAIRPLPASGAR